MEFGVFCSRQCDCENHHSAFYPADFLRRHLLDCECIACSIAHRRGDQQRFAQVRSPLADTAARFPDDPEARAWFARTYPQYLAFESAAFLMATHMAGMAVTGSLLFSAEASHLALNPVFQLKALLVAAGLINVATYQFWARRAVEHLAPGAAMPARAKVTGAVSLAVWIAVAACGRSIAYF